MQATRVDERTVLSPFFAGVFKASLWSGCLFGHGSFRVCLHWVGRVGLFASPLFDELNTALRAACRLSQYIVSDATSPTAVGALPSV